MMSKCVMAERYKSYRSDPQALSVGFLSARAVVFVMTREERLQAARVAAGFASAADAARAHGWNANTYRANENGNAPFGFKAAERFARAFGVNPRWLYSGTGLRSPSDSDALAEFMVVGTVSAGVTEVFLDQTDMHAPHDMVRVRSGGDRLAARVVGSSMMPRFRDGEYLIFGPPTDPAQLVGQDIMAQIRNGPTAVKILRRGPSPGTWTLDNYNPAFDAVEGVELEWARPFEGMIR
jgi:phage repressor protein C with HTH and peptisase S24 domain